MILRICCAALLAATVCGSAHAAQDEYEQRVNKGMSLISVFPGMTRTSAPLTIRVNSSKIPDNAVVEKVTVVTGNVAADRRATSTIVIESYNVKGPNMESFAPKRWAGKGRPTTFDADELGGHDVPVKGLWQLSMTGNNVGTARATANHTVRAIEFKYRY